MSISITHFCFMKHFYHPKYLYIHLLCTSLQCIFTFYLFYCCCPQYEKGRDTIKCTSAQVEQKQYIPNDAYFIALSYILDFLAPVELIPDTLFILENMAKFLKL